MNSGDIFKLQKILGHRSIEMTLRYTHLAPHAFADDYGRLPEVSGQFTSGASDEEEVTQEPRRIHA
jgi:hypothetical protein